MADKKHLEILKQGVEVWNKWSLENGFMENDLSGADLRKVDLTGALFIDADLVGAYLRNANLTGVKFTNASLEEANLSGATLMEADFTSAELLWTDFTGADLRNANLSTATLWAANFTGAVLINTDFSDSDMNYTIFGDNDLSDSIGLQTVEHHGPSKIGVDTIRRSQGKISIEFLRGCGLSDLEIEYAKLAAPGLDPDHVEQITDKIYRLYCDRPIQFYDCFISFSNKDQGFAQRLHDDLQDNGVRCYFAPEDMKIGDEFRKIIGQQIRLRDKFLIILSENSFQSEWVGDEVEKALSEEKEQGVLKLFPIRLDDAVLKSKDDWAEKIRLRRHIGDFSNWQDKESYQKEFARLLRDLKSQ